MFSSDFRRVVRDVTAVEPRQRRPCELVKKRQTKPKPERRLAKFFCGG